MQHAIFEGTADMMMSNNLKLRKESVRVCCNALMCSEPDSVLTIIKTHDYFLGNLIGGTKTA
jgi:hypothetical protein